jgi:hypothetical protein
VDLENFDRSAGRSVIKDAYCEPPGEPRERIKISPFLFEDRPMCMLMVPMDDVSLAVTPLIIIWIDFPYKAFGVLLIQRTVWIDASVYENAVLIDIHQR